MVLCSILFTIRGKSLETSETFSLTRQAIDDYQMIEEGDRIAIGISGGKDSLTLLYAMQGLQKFYPKRFELEAVTVDLGYPGFDLEPIRQLCQKLQVPYNVIPTQIGKIVFEERQESNPCALCAKLRKGAFNDRIKELGCNKVAYAHHKDDMVETMLLSLMYEGRFHSFLPKTYLDRMDLTVIRPLIYVSESEVIGFRNKYHLPVAKSPCPADGYTKRQYVKDLLRKLNQENPGVKDRMFSAIVNGHLEDWPES